MTDAQAPARIHWLYPLVLVICGVLGIIAAFNLTLDEITVAANPNAHLSCSINPFIECSSNLKSWQGHLFGFPNPIIGLLCWPATIVVAAGVLAGARFARWFWMLFNLGLLGAFVFCVWLMTQSFFVIHSICVWCVLTWSVAIIGFVATTSLNLARGIYGEGARPAGRFLLRWSPLVVIVIYLIFATIAQIQFDLIGYFLRR